jgi:hypothetical protein
MFQGRDVKELSVKLGKCPEETLEILQNAYGTALSALMMEEF